MSKIGSQGQEVTNIQTRLKSWGYYSGSVDGIYGWRTANAVKEFQRKNGLTADGIAGPATLSKIGLPTGSSSSSYSNDTTLLAMVINGEARGESYEGPKQFIITSVRFDMVNHRSLNVFPVPLTNLAQRMFSKICLA